MLALVKTTPPSLGCYVYSNSTEKASSSNQITNTDILGD